MGRALTGATARFSGVVAGPQTAGDAEIAGTLDGVPVRGAARLAAGENGARRLENLLLGVGESRASGELTLGADNLLTGTLNVVSPDLSKVAPLFLVNASGALNADVTLTAENGGAIRDIFRNCDQPRLRERDAAIGGDFGAGARPLPAAAAAGAILAAQPADRRPADRHRHGDGDAAGPVDRLLGGRHARRRQRQVAGQPGSARPGPRHRAAERSPIPAPGSA